MAGCARPERLTEIADRFGTLVEDQVVAAPMIKGADQFLGVHASATTLTVASATPTEELRRIVKRRGIGRCFAAVDGSPSPKGSIVVEHMSRFSVGAPRTVMVGDQMSDYRAAEYAGVRFIGVGHDAPRLEATAVIVADLSELESALRTISRHSDSDGVDR